MGDFSAEALLTRLLRTASVTGDEQGVLDDLEKLLEQSSAFWRFDSAPAAAAPPLGNVRLRKWAVPVASLASDAAFPGHEVDRGPDGLVPALLVTVDRPGPRDGTSSDEMAAAPHVLLAAHVDVVPPGDVSTWTGDPFEPRWFGPGEGPAAGEEKTSRYVVARGACDMKGGLVSLLLALRRLRAERHDGCVTLALVASEEDGGMGMLAVIRRLQEEVERGELTLPRAAVIPEPTGGGIVTAHAGALTFTLQVPGKAAHAATRREGVSALSNALPLLRVLEENEEARNAVVPDARMRALGLPYPTIVGKIRGGEWASSVIDSVTIEGRYGVTLEQSCQEAEAELRAALTGVWSQHDFLREHTMDMAITGAAFEPCAVDEASPNVQAFLAAAADVTGGPVATIGAPYGADMRLLVNVASIETVMYGPGSILHAHAADERVALDDVLTVANVVHRWVQRLGKT